MKITIAGSVTFAKKQLNIKKELEKIGHIEVLCKNVIDQEFDKYKNKLEKDLSPQSM